MVFYFCIIIIIIMNTQIKALWHCYSLNLLLQYDLISPYCTP